MKSSFGAPSPEAGAPVRDWPCPAAGGGGDPAGVPGGGAAQASPHRVNPASHQYPVAFNRCPT